MAPKTASGLITECDYHEIDMKYCHSSILTSVTRELLVVSPEYFKTFVARVLSDVM